MVIEERGVVGGHGEKERGAISLDIGVNAGGRGGSGGENRGCATGKREVAGVAETVGEKEAGQKKGAGRLGEVDGGEGRRGAVPVPDGVQVLEAPPEPG